MKKAVLWILVVFILLIISLFALPFIFKDKILEKVKTEINNNLNAKVNFDDFDLTLISSFPDFTIALNNLVITGINEFEGDTLASIKEFKLGADLMSIIKGGTIRINAVSVDKPLVNLLKLKNGKANWDISKPTPTPSPGGESSTAFKLNLKQYEIINGEISFLDEVSNMYASLNNLNHSGSGDFTTDLFLLKTITSIDALNFTSGGVRYLYQVKTDLKADLEMNMVTSTYTFKENELSLNHLVLGFDGSVSMSGNDIITDLKFNARKTEFKNFISLIPGIYKEGFKDLKSSGKLALDGFVKGKYNENTLPGFGLNILIQNGMFQYPGLPAAVNNVQMDLKVLNADGIPDHTMIDLKRLHAELAAEPFDASIRIATPVSDPDIDAVVKGKINLANISKIVPLEKGTNLNGQLDVDLKANGRLSAIEKKNYDQFNAAGHLVLSGMTYTSPDFKNSLNINTFDITFNPLSVSLNSCDIKTGKSDIQADGQIDNLLSWYFKKQTLSGTFNLNSGLLDINELMNDKKAESSLEDTTSSGVPEVPDLINFTLNVSIKKLIYDDMTMENLKGQVVMANQAIHMKNLDFQMLDGTLSAKGSYDSKNKNQPHLDLELDIKNADIQKSLKTFNTIRILAPVAERCDGSFSSSIALSTALDKQMNPVLTTLNGAGRLTTGNVVLTNFEVLNKLADAVKLDQFKKLNLSNINISFHFKNGRVNIDPFDANLAGVKTTIQGSNGFDQSIDYSMNMQIPKSMMGTAANNAITGLFAGANKAAGTNFSMPDPVKIKAMIGGTITKPIIKTGLGDQGGSVVDDLKDKAKAEFDKKKKELEDKARAEADRLKKELEDKAKSEADKLKKEAEAKAKAESEKLKKEAEQKAKKAAEDQLKNIFKKPK